MFGWCSLKSRNDGPTVLSFGICSYMWKCYPPSSCFSSAISSLFMMFNFDLMNSSSSCLLNELFVYEYVINDFVYILIYFIILIYL